MDLLSGEDINGTSALNQNFSSETLSAVNNKMRSACDGGFAWSVHGPLIVVCVLIIAFNSAVMALMRWKESLRTLSNTILVSLAVSDLISGLFGIPLIFGCSKAILTGQIAVCVASTLFMRLTAVSTVLHFLLVACDRYIMIKISMRHQALVTKRRIWCALISMWLISLLVTSVQLAWFGTRNIIKKDIIYFTVLIVAFLAVPLISILCIYAHHFFYYLGINASPPRTACSSRELEQRTYQYEIDHARFARYPDFDLDAGNFWRLLASFLPNDPSRSHWCSTDFRRLVEIMFSTLCPFHSTRDKSYFLCVWQARFQERFPRVGEILSIQPWRGLQQCFSQHFLTQCKKPLWQIYSKCGRFSKWL